ncbi:MAG: proton-conducting transporter membrane subunit, partial [Pseudomonadota bacterium]
MTAAAIALAVFFAAPLAFAAAAFAAPGPRPPAARRALLVGAALALAAAAAALTAALAGPATLRPLGPDLAPLSLRLDAVSATLLLVIGIVGAVVLVYSRAYLDGDARQGRFLGWMSLTLCAVGLLVAAGDLVTLALAWIAVSLSLDRLLLHNAERAGARRAARKKFIASRMSDAALIGAAALIWSSFGAIDLATIGAQARAAAEAGAVSSLAQWAAALIALAAVLKSAQFPAHGWLTEAMEAPTPVSALLHAGVINAGGFLLIRFSDLLIGAPGVLAALVIIGGFTALFGGLAMLTQPAVKTGLAWSTISQMGFMVLQCGLALFPLALLHIAAHSLYKAHAFLSSGGAVARVAALRQPGPVAAPSLGAVGRAFGVAAAIYAAVAVAFALVVGLDDKSPQALALGAILIFGVAYLLAQGFADAAPAALARRTALAAAAAAAAYLTLQTGAEALYAGALPAAPRPGPLEWALLVLALGSFGAVAIAQATLPLWAGHPAAAGLRVHLTNGLYVNALTDRLMGGWARPPAPEPARPPAST